MRAPKGRALRVCAEHPAAEERVALSLLDGRLGERSHALGEVFLAVVDGFLVLWFPPNRGGFGYAASPAGTAVLVS